MRTTRSVDNSLLSRAMEVTGIKGKSAVVNAGLKALIQKAAAERLIALGGSDPKATAGRRRRFTR